MLFYKLSHLEFNCIKNTFQFHTCTSYVTKHVTYHFSAAVLKFRSSLDTHMNLTLLTLKILINSCQELKKNLKILLTFSSNVSKQNWIVATCLKQIFIKNSKTISAYPGYYSELPRDCMQFYLKRL